MPTTKQVLEDAIKRGKIRKAQLVQEAGGFLTTADAARVLGIDARHLRENRSLIAVRMDSGDIGYPAFQFENEAMLAGVAAVLAAIGVDEPWMRLSFFFLRLDELERRRPIDAIRDGSIKAVVLAAHHFGEHGAS